MKNKDFFFVGGGYFEQSLFPMSNLNFSTSKMTPNNMKF